MTWNRWPRPWKSRSPPAASSRTTPTAAAAAINAVRNGGAPSRNRRLDVTDHILAARLRSHLNLPTQAIGVLLGVDPATISHATTLTAELLAAARIPLPATAPPPAVIPRTPAELLQYAAAAGSTLTIPENGQTMPEHFKPRQRKLRHART